MKLHCVNLNADIDVAEGLSLSRVCEDLRAAGSLGFAPLCALVNNKEEDLSYRLFSPKRVEFLPIDSAEGRRCYIRSLCMMLYRAAETLYPGSRLAIEHSVCGGYYLRITGTPADVSAEALSREMLRLVQAALPFERHERLTEEVMEIFRSQGLDDKVLLLQTTAGLYTSYYSLCGLCDCYYGPLAPATDLLGVFSLTPYKEGFLLCGPQPGHPSQVAMPVSQPKLFEAFTSYVRFGRVIGVSNAGQLNMVARQERTSMMINVAEALHTKYISEIADEITRRYRTSGGARVVLVAGPSSSGKTTFTKRLAVQLLTNLLQPVMISLDDYFVDRHLTPRDCDNPSDYDFEHINALDLDLLGEHLEALLAGEEISLPTYNFSLGKREYLGRKLRLAPDSVLLIEGIHGLNPQLTRTIADEQKFRIYVSALTTLQIDDHNWMSTTDNRLLRRIIRDYKYRGTSPLDTIRRWPSVRRGEERWIFPYQEQADAMFNSSLLFEIGVYKDEAERVLRTVPNTEAEYAVAYRLRRLLACFLPIPDKMIPPTSLLREFLGGSSFHY